LECEEERARHEKEVLELQRKESRQQAKMESHPVVNLKPTRI